MDITNTVVADAKEYWERKGHPVLEFPSNPSLTASLLKMAVYGFLDATDPEYNREAEARLAEMEEAEKNQPRLYATPPTPAQAFQADFEAAYSPDGTAGFTHCQDMARATLKHFDVHDSSVSINRLAKIYQDYREGIALSIGYDVVKDASNRPIGNILGWYRGKCREAKQDIDNIKRDTDRQNY